MSVPFRERNPVVIGAISIAVLIALMIAAFKAGDLPLIGGGDTYKASFSEASGIKTNDEVRIAGVRVGKVTAVDLKGDHVDVTDQTADQLPALGPVEIDRDHPLARVVLHEEAGADRAGPAEPPHLVALGRLELDDVGAEVGEQHRRERPRQYAAGVDHPNALEGQRVIHDSYGR